MDYYNVLQTREKKTNVPNEPFNYTLDYLITTRGLSQYKYEETQRQINFIQEQYEIFKSLSFNPPIGIEIYSISLSNNSLWDLGLDETEKEQIRNMYNQDLEAVSKLEEFFTKNIKWSFLFNITGQPFRKTPEGGSMSFGWNFQNHIFSMKFKGDVFISKKLLFHLNNIEPKITAISVKIGEIILSVFAFSFRKAKNSAIRKVSTSH
jgi:hypothetical protein